MRKAKQKFDTAMLVKKPAFWTKPIIRVGTAFLTMGHGGKVEKINCEGLKPPYILLSTHASMIDFAVASRAIKPHLANWVISIEEFVGREWLLRQVGGIYKRKFTSDVMVVKHILTSLTKNKDIVIIYPEARFSIAGVNEAVDGALGKLAKAAKCPVVFLQMRGNFLMSPQWNKHPYRKVPVSAVMEQIVTREEAETLSAAQIQERIEKKFDYDEYKWQRDNGIVIDSEYRAHNIHKILYQCPRCKKEFTTRSEKTKIWCVDCGATYEMDTLGRLKATEGETEFDLVSDWYRFERKQVNEEVASGKYFFEDTVRVEHLKSSAAGCVPIGEVKLTHGYDGFTLEGKLYDGSDFYLHRDPETMRSCHIEYDYKKRGGALELCTLKDTYFVFPLNKFNPLTKLHFATEAVYEYTLNKEKSQDESI